MRNEAIKLKWPSILGRGKVTTRRDVQEEGVRKERHRLFSSLNLGAIDKNIFCYFFH